MQLKQNNTILRKLFLATFFAALVGVSSVFAYYGLPPPVQLQPTQPPQLPFSANRLSPSSSSSFPRSYSPQLYGPPTRVQQPEESFSFLKSLPTKFLPFSQVDSKPEYPTDDLPVDLDLADFADRNPLPKEHCFFPVKGRKDIVEYKPDEGGIFNFPTGFCKLSDEKCFRGDRNYRFPKMKKTDPPVYSSQQESQYLDLPVIPYKYVDEIDFSKCVPSWTGYFEAYHKDPREATTTYYSNNPGEAANNLAYLYTPPKRDYSKQSCYHPINYSVLMDNTLDDHHIIYNNIFCDAEKCQLTESQYCENKSGKCYRNGYQLKTEDGKSVTTFEYYPYINWNFCTNKDGSLIPEDGGPQYEERFKAGCSYRVTWKNFSELANSENPKPGTNVDSLIKCDENRCFSPWLDFDMKRKEYWLKAANDKTLYSKTPFFGEVPNLDWQCRDAEKTPGYKQFLCSPVSGWDGAAPDCRLCYEKKKFVYHDCRITYDEFGQRTDIPESIRGYNMYDEAERTKKIISSMRDNSEIPWETAGWFKGFLGNTFQLNDEIQRHRLAFILWQFNELAAPNEEDVAKLKTGVAPFVLEGMKKPIYDFVEGSLKEMRFPRAVRGL